MAGCAVLQLVAVVFFTLISVAAQRVGTRPLCRSQADICFLIDSSGSIRDNNPDDGSYDNWTLLLEFIAYTIRSFDVGSNKVRFGAVKFSTDAEVMFNLEKYFDKDDMVQQVKSMEYTGGYTNTYQGLNTLREDCFGTGNGDRPNVSNIAIVVTDGKPTLRESHWQSEAQTVKDNGIFIMAVGITDQIRSSTLRILSSQPQLLGRTYFQITEFRYLNDVSYILVNEMCSISGGSLVTTTTTTQPSTTQVQLYKGTRRTVVDNDTGCAVICTAEYSPVCGTDYNTYSNLCNLRVARCQSVSPITKRYDGECSCVGSAACRVEYMYQDHCGSDGQTYSNQCYFNYAKLCSPGLTLRHLGICTTHMVRTTPGTTVNNGTGEDSPICDIVCPAIYDPVCGSDYKTYSNLCTLVVKQCQSPDINLQLLRKGMCNSGSFTNEYSPSCDLSCPANYDPVCGTDYHTYTNLCALRVQQCESPNINLKLLAKGDCNSAINVGTYSGTSFPEKVFLTTLLTMLVLIFI